MRISIIGLGLIGGSMAIDLKRRNFSEEIWGVESDPVNAEAAKNIGIVDRVVSLEECISGSKVIIMAIPVGSAVKLLPYILDNLGDPDQIVMDVCSCKSFLAETVKTHPNRRQYVSSHPMAGTEYSGPWAAMPNLFDGHACIICDKEKSSSKAVEIVESLYDTLNMRLTYMDSFNHDVHTAYVSHISHITSFALALTVLEKERDEKHIFDLASGGFSSTVRLAKSNPDMWTPIFAQNKDNVLHVMDTYIEKMQAFREAIAKGQEQNVRALIEEANKIKRIIK